MADLEVRQVPARVNLQITNGDDWSRLIDFDINLTGYTFTAKVGGSVSMTVAETDLAAGKITLSLPGSVTALIQNGTEWYLTWLIGGNTRKIFEGVITT